MRRISIVLYLILLSSCYNDKIMTYLNLDNQVMVIPLQEIQNDISYQNDEVSMFILSNVDKIKRKDVYIIRVFIINDSNKGYFFPVKDYSPYFKVATSFIDNRKTFIKKNSNDYIDTTLEKNDFYFIQSGQVLMIEYRFQCLKTSFLQKTLLKTKRKSGYFLHNKDLGYLRISLFSNLIVRGEYQISSYDKKRAKQLECLPTYDNDLLSNPITLKLKPGKSKEFEEKNRVN